MRELICFGVDLGDLAPGEGFEFGRAPYPTIHRAKKFGDFCKRESYGLRHRDKVQAYHRAFIIDAPSRFSRRTRQNPSRFVIPDRRCREASLLRKIPNFHGKALT